MNHLLPDFLREALKQELPGKEAHDLMLRRRRPTPEEAYEQKLEPKESAVIMLLYPHEHNWSTVLILRPSYDGVHSQQIGFPGGKIEVDDPSLEHGALRELHEELGVAPDQVEVIGKLSSLYIPPSNFIVQPFVGVVAERPVFIPDAREVEQIIETPVHRFFEKDVIGNTNLFIKRYNTELNVEYFDIQNHVVWGATAMMISEFREIAKPVFLPQT